MFKSEGRKIPKKRNLLIVYIQITPLALGKRRNLSVKYSLAKRLGGLSQMANCGLSRQFS